MEISNSLMEVHRNWLDLPRDVTLTIMKKLDVSEILKSAQFVCKMWYTFCKEPSLWRTLRIRGLKDPEMKFRFTYKGKMKDEENAGMKMMFISGVDRSNGGLLELDIEGFCPEDLFVYAIFWSSQLKRLRLARCEGDFVQTLKGFIETNEMLPCLEELELTLCNIQTLDIISIISSCSALTIFKLNKQSSPNPYSASDDEALAIATGMPKLCHLQLIGNNITNVGLIAILDGCPLLQSLDLRACFRLDIAGSLRKRLLEKIKDLRLPDDSIDDYKYKRRIMEFYDDYDDIPEVDIVSESDYDISYQNDFNYDFWY